MQALWGRILAGEIKQPKSYSLRTLELLKNLSKDEAEVFTKFANLKIVSGDKSFIYDHDDGEFLKLKFGITFPDILLLKELGLLINQNDLLLSFDETYQLGETNNLIWGNKCIILNRDAYTPKQVISALIFT